MMGSMGTDIFKVDASWADKLTKTRVQFSPLAQTDIYFVTFDTCYSSFCSHWVTHAIKIITCNSPPIGVTQSATHLILSSYWFSLVN